MIQINKQLERPDGGDVSSGSIVKYNTNLNGDMSVLFDLKHYVSEASLDSGKTTIPKVVDFSYRIGKQCTIEEWAALNDAGSAELVEGWLKEMIDSNIGAGYTAIV